MRAVGSFSPSVKVLVFYAVFMALYGLYRFFPVFPLSLIAGVSESNFQHYKATFFAFLIAYGIEYLAHRRNILDKARFWYPRLLATLFSPLVVFLLWYIAPAVYGQMPSTALEIVYANIMILLVGVIVNIFQSSFATMQFSRSLKAVIWILLVVSVGLYWIFTFSHLPWADVFVEPKWR